MSQTQRERQIKEKEKEKEKKITYVGESKKSNRETLNLCLITKMLLKTKFWKLKTPKMCFKFP